MPRFELRVTAQATIEEIWVIEADSEEEAREIFEDEDTNRMEFVQDRVIGNEEDRQIHAIEELPGD